ncbi:hypothetical protein ACFPOI_32955 [Nonomuraea angiospora]|uniref:Antitoxin n=1 Tax=Nonomuraea angiospora TaxID=46172 RepID=A0ABR9LSJ5_9ACTN|nr:hypothetical protein [Nonomuraea angiospora]MBE1583643.1 hypothetical protein [Nonomuraea angiospora]
MTRIVLHIDRVVLESAGHSRQELIDALTEAVRRELADGPAGPARRRRLSVEAADGSTPGLAQAVVAGIRGLAGGGQR